MRQFDQQFQQYISTDYVRLKYGNLPDPLGVDETLTGIPDTASFSAARTSTYPARPSSTRDIRLASSAMPSSRTLDCPARCPIATRGRYVPIPAWVTPPPWITRAVANTGTDPRSSPSIGTTSHQRTSNHLQQASLLPTQRQRHRSDPRRFHRLLLTIEIPERRLRRRRPERARKLWL